MWPDPRGKARGIALEPLHASVAKLVQHDPELAEQLALIDAIRLSDGRIRSLSAMRLAERTAAGAKVR